MTYEDRTIRYAARAICAEQEQKSGSNNWAFYITGAWDDTVWMRLAERSIREGIEIGGSL